MTSIVRQRVLDRARGALHDAVRIVVDRRVRVFLRGVRDAEQQHRAHANRVELAALAHHRVDRVARHARHRADRLHDVAAFDDEQRLHEPVAVDPRLAHERAHAGAGAQPPRPRNEAPLPDDMNHAPFSSTKRVTLCTNAPTSGEGATTSGGQPCSPAVADDDASHRGDQRPVTRCRAGPTDSR